MGNILVILLKGIENRAITAGQQPIKQEKLFIYNILSYNLRDLKTIVKEPEDLPAVSKEPIFAAIDIGSHTIRLLIAAYRDNCQLIPLCVERRVTRLAKGFDSCSMLDRQSMRHSIQVLEEYLGLIKTYGVTAIVCGATGVVRKAKNGAAFLEEIHARTGISGTILSEQSEAFLSAKGMLSVLPKKERHALLFDLGGSSTEFILVDPKQSEPVWTGSIFIGAATVTERYLPGDPPSNEALKQATRAIRQSLEPVAAMVSERLHRTVRSPRDLTVVGTAGTVTTLAAMRQQMTTYRPHRINGCRLSRRWIAETTQRLAVLPVTLRRNVLGLEKDRADIILGGALIVCELLGALQHEILVVTDAGLLEGLLIGKVETELGRPQALASPLSWVWR
jgi:exopolyphosphatase/guanosine-5'-triphosphate,3'-diphosphate pyrophosphatase